MTIPANLHWGALGAMVVGAEVVGAMVGAGVATVGAIVGNGVGSGVGVWVMPAGHLQIQVGESGRKGPVRCKWVQGWVGGVWGLSS